jgi:hypothetical protein
MDGITVEVQVSGLGVYTVVLDDTEFYAVSIAVPAIASVAAGADATI